MSSNPGCICRPFSELRLGATCNCFQSVGYRKAVDPDVNVQTVGLKMSVWEGQDDGST